MTNNTNTQQKTDTKRAGACLLTGGNSSPNTTYDRKLALDIRSQLSNEKRAKKNVNNNVVKRNSDENSVYSEKLAIDSRSRKTRAANTSLNTAAAESDFNGCDDTSVAESETIEESNALITPDIEAPGPVQVASEQISTTLADLIATQSLEAEKEKSTSDLVVAYTVDDDDDDKSVFVAEPLKEEEGKKWRRIAIALLLCLMLIGLTLGVAIPLSPPGRLPASEAPSLTPTGMPSTAPTESPAPSPAPSGLPTVAPTADFCAVTYDITCRELETQKSCTEFLEELLEDQTVGDNCRSDPLEIKFSYLGGSCNDTWTEASVACVDYNNGPPESTESDEPARIVIESTKTPGLTYFDGLIAPRGEFKLTGHNHPDPIKDILNVSIYSTTDGGEDLLQSSQIPFDCPEGQINLLDRYGAVVFTGFTSIEQGQWTGFDSLDLSEYTMVLSVRATNHGVSRLDLDSLLISSTAEIVDAEGVSNGIDAYGASFFNFTAKAQSQGSLEPSESFAVDMVTHFHVNEMRTLLVTLSGETAAHTPCDEFELLNYTLSTPSSVTGPQHGGFS